MGMLTSGRTCTPTLSCLEAPPCTPVLLTVCRRRSLPWLLPPSRSRSSLPQRGSTPSGSEDPFWPLSPPSSRCGSPSRSTMSAAPPSSTGSASKYNSIVDICSMYKTFQNVGLKLNACNNKNQLQCFRKKKKKKKKSSVFLKKKKKKKKKK